MEMDIQSISLPKYVIDKNIEDIYYNADAIAALNGYALEARSCAIIECTDVTFLVVGPGGVNEGGAPTSTGLGTLIKSQCPLGIVDNAVELSQGLGAGAKVRKISYGTNDPRPEDMQVGEVYLKLSGTQ